MTRRTLQLPVLAITLLVAALVAPSVYFAHGWQLRRLSKALLKYAEAEQHRDNWLQAAGYLDRYLRVRPRDVGVRGQLANVYAKAASTRAQRRRAVVLHYRVLADEPPKEDANRLRCSLAQVLMDSGRFLEAEREARCVIANNPDDAVANRALALALYAQWQNGSLAAVNLGNVNVLAAVEEARRLNPTDVLVAEIAAAIYRDHPILVAIDSPASDGAVRLAKADACLNELVENSGNDPKAYLARYRYRARNQLAGAQSDLEKALEFGPQDPQVLLAAAQSAYDEAQQSKSRAQEPTKIRERFAAARQYYEQLVEERQLASSPEPRLGLGDALVGLGELDKAIEVWKRGLKQFVQPTVQLRFQARIADNLLVAERTNEMAEPLGAIDSMIASLGASITKEERLTLVQAQDLRRASWHMQQGRPAAALPLLQDVAARQASFTANNEAVVVWNMLGRANAMLGEWAEAAAAFDRAIPLEADNSASRLASAYAWLQMGRSDIAVERAEQALLVHASPEAWFVLAAADYQLQLARPPIKRSWRRIENALQAIEQGPAGSLASAPWRADLLWADLAYTKGLDADKPDRARMDALSVLKQATAKYATAPEFWCQACLVYQRLGMAADADRAVNKVQSLGSPAADVAIVKANLAKLRMDYGRAAQVLSAAAANAPAPLQSRLRLELADVALAEGDSDRAYNLLSVEAESRPADIVFLRRLAELALERKDEAAAAQWESKLAAAGPPGYWWARYFRTLRLYQTARSADDPKLSDALDEQAWLVALRPHWPVAVSLRGMIEQRMGKLEEAAASFEQAVQLGERRSAVFEQLISLLDRLNRSADAEAYLGRLESCVACSQRLTEIASNQELRQQRPEQALQIARKAAQTRPHDALAHLWLGRLLLVTGNAAEAKRELERSAELAPQDVRTWNGLFSFYLRNKSTEKAREILRRLAQEADLDTADRNFVVAQGHELLGEWELAAKEYEAAAQEAPDRAQIYVRLAGVYRRSDPQRAATSLRKALEIDSRLTVARRMLAAIVAASGAATDFAEAEQLLNGNSTGSDSIGLEDRRLNAMLLAQYGQPAHLERAIQLLEELVSQTQGSSLADRVTLARLYESHASITLDPNAAAAKRATARNHLIAAASAANAEPSQVASLIDFFLRNDQWQQASQWLDKFETILRSGPSVDAQAIAQFIELRLRHGSADRCVEWLDRLAQLKTDPIVTLAMRCKWLHAAGKASEIPSLVEPMAEEWIASAEDAQERARVARATADIYLSTGQLENAEPWHRTLADNDPSQIALLVSTLARTRKLHEAIQICRSQVSTGENSRAVVVLTTALAEMPAAHSDVAAVEPVLAAALVKFPKDAELLYAIGTFRATQHDYREAVRLYREVVNLDPKHVSALNNLATIRAESPSNRVEALAIIEKAIDLVGPQPSLLDTKGAILTSLGRSDEALLLLEAAVREQSADVRHRFHLAAAYRDLGEFNKARGQLRMALDQHLELQFLTQTDRVLLTELKAALIP